MPPAHRQCSSCAAAPGPSPSKPHLAFSAYFHYDFIRLTHQPESILHHATSTAADSFMLASANWSAAFMQRSKVSALVILAPQPSAKVKRIHSHRDPTFKKQNKRTNDYLYFLAARSRKTTFHLWGYTSTHQHQTVAHALTALHAKYTAMSH